MKVVSQLNHFLLLLLWTFEKSLQDLEYHFYSLKIVGWMNQIFVWGVSFQLYVHYTQPLSSPQDNTYPIYYICPLIFFDSFKEKKTSVRDVVKRLILYNMRKIQRLQISVRTSIFFLPYISCIRAKCIEIVQEKMC